MLVARYTKKYPTREILLGGPGESTARYTRKHIAKEREHTRGKIPGRVERVSSPTFYARPSERSSGKKKKKIGMEGGRKEKVWGRLEHSYHYALRWRELPDLGGIGGQIKKNPELEMIFGTAAGLTPISMLQKANIIEGIKDPRA